MESTNKAAVCSLFLFLGFACRSGFELCGWKSAWSCLESAVELWLTHFDHTVSFILLAQFVLESFRCIRWLIYDILKSTISAQVSGQYWNVNKNSTKCMKGCNMTSFFSLLMVVLYITEKLIIHIQQIIALVNWELYICGNGNTRNYRQHSVIATERKIEWCYVCKWGASLCRDVLFYFWKIIAECHNVLVPVSNYFRNIKIRSFTFEHWYISRGTELAIVTVIYNNIT